MLCSNIRHPDQIESQNSKLSPFLSDLSIFFGRSGGILLERQKDRAERSTLIHQQTRHTRKEAHSRRQLPILRNERLTAVAGLVLFVLILVELLVTANLHHLLSVHIFVGVVLSGPLVVKMLSTGYRFVRYYTGSPVFVEKGPPHWLLRLAAPFLVFLTLLVFISGFALAFLGPNHMGIFFEVHAASVALWIPLTAVHVYAHFRKVPRLVVHDLTKQPGFHVSGRNGRIALNVLSLIVGLVAAIVMIPVSSPWSHWRFARDFSPPLAAGIVLAVVALVVAIPLLRPRKMEGAFRRL